MKKHWYDYLWILSSLYLILGFFNILFAWLGLLCFFIPGYGVEIKYDVVYNSIGLVPSEEGFHKIWIKVVQ